MSTLFNIYCDESCHLEHDNQKVMVLGGVWCQQSNVRTIIDDIRRIKEKHGFHSNFEIKWVKVSPQKQDFYLEIVDYFFQNAGLRFRALVVPDKTLLRHEEHHQTHDEWYYKMYFEMLNTIIDPHERYNIYLDIKDSRGGAKVIKLKEVLSNAHYDFSRTIVHNIQIIRSHEVALLQLADLLIGAVGYANRDFKSSMAKFAIVARLRKHTNYTLKQSTLLAEKKFNLLIWKPWEA